MCPQGYECAPGTGEGQKFRSRCPIGYFCPAGSGRTMYGRMANDGLSRGLVAAEINPFTPPFVHEQILSPGELRPRDVNATINSVTMVSMNII